MVCNTTITGSSKVNNAVLYCRERDLWKLTDFGISANATSKQAQPTVFSRGTPSYRAPEILNHQATFTNKVDIWSLGCILHKLVTSKNTFEDDLAVQKCYETSEFGPKVFIASSSRFLEHHVSENIRGLLQRDPRHRPRASTLCVIFSFHERFHLLHDRYDTIQQSLKASEYPSYTIWKRLTERHYFEPQFIIHLATEYAKRNEEVIGVMLLREAFQTTQKPLSKPSGIAINLESQEDEEALLRLQDALMMEGFFDTAILFLNTIISGGLDKPCFQKQLAMTFIAQGNNRMAIETCMHVLTGNSDYWLWHDFCHLFLSSGYMDEAKGLCYWGIKNLPTDPSPFMVLSDLHAANGNRHEAIKLHVGWWTDNVNELQLKQNLLSALLTENAYLAQVLRNKDKDTVKMLMKRY